MIDNYLLNAGISVSFCDQRTVLFTSQHNRALSGKVHGKTHAVLGLMRERGWWLQRTSHMSPYARSSPRFSSISHGSTPDFQSSSSRLFNRPDMEITWEDSQDNTFQGCGWLNSHLSLVFLSPDCCENPQSVPSKGSVTTWWELVRKSSRRSLFSREGLQC